MISERLARELHARGIDTKALRAGHRRRLTALVERFFEQVRLAERGLAYNKRRMSHDRALEVCRQAILSSLKDLVNKIFCYAQEVTGLRGARFKADWVGEDLAYNVGNEVHFNIPLLLGELQRVCVAPWCIAAFIFVVLVHELTHFKYCDSRDPDRCNHERCQAANHDAEFRADEEAAEWSYWVGLTFADIEPMIGIFLDIETPTHPSRAERRFNLYAAWRSAKEADESERIRAQAIRDYRMYRRFETLEHWVRW